MRTTEQNGVDRVVTSRRQLLGGAVGTTLAGGLLRQDWARSQEATPQPAVSIHRGPTTKSLVSLTWDCGADRGYAASILDTLAGTGI